MSIAEELILLKDEEVSDYISKRIEDLEDESRQLDEEEYKESLGYLLDMNYNNKLLLNKEDEEKASRISIRCFYPDFIRKGYKIVYGTTKDEYSKHRNSGLYYYMDTYDYIFEFCDYLRLTGYTDKYDLIDCIHLFMRRYFGSDNYSKVERDKMFSLIVDENDNYFKPYNEHGISWFKNKGNALCSEYSVIGQNLMTFLGINSYLAIGRVTHEQKIESHAYNLVILEDEDSQTDIKMLVDYANSVSIFDINLKYVTSAPYITILEKLDSDYLESLVRHNEKITDKDYIYQIVGKTMVKLATKNIRDYYLCVWAAEDEVKKVLTKTKNG